MKVKGCVNKGKAPSEIYKIIEISHDWRTVHARLSLDLKVIEEDKKNLTRKVSLKMYAVYDEFESIPQSTQIPAGVFVELCKYTLVWGTIQDFEKMTEPKSLDYNDFECDTFFEWDSPNLPKEVIENACNKIIIDEVQFSEDLIEHYGRLEEVDFGDFPKSLKPLIEASIAEYKQYNKFYGYPKAVN